MSAWGGCECIASCTVPALIVMCIGSHGETETNGRFALRIARARGGKCMRMRYCSRLAHAHKRTPTFYSSAERF